jgi:predicted dithiol-disulfide oxidoreductase (DUF899 family)
LPLADLFGHLTLLALICRIFPPTPQLFESGIHKSSSSWFAFWCVLAAISHVQIPPRVVSECCDRATDVATLRAYGRARAWDKLRLISAGNSIFNYDSGGEDAEGHKDSAISVFTRDAEGKVRRFYSAHPRMATEIPERGIDLLAPV